MRLLTIGALMLTMFAGAQDLAPEERTAGFASLFDGATLANWHAIPLGATPGAWVARDGVLTHTPGDSWLASDKTYTDFVLRLEYRTGNGSDSGIFVRSTPDGYPSFTGMEMEIRNGADGGTAGPASGVAARSPRPAIEPRTATSSVRDVNPLLGAEV